MPTSALVLARHAPLALGVTVALAACEEPKIVLRLTGQGRVSAPELGFECVGPKACVLQFGERRAPVKLRVEPSEGWTLASSCGEVQDGELGLAPPATDQRCALTFAPCEPAGPLAQLSGPWREAYSCVDAQDRCKIGPDEMSYVNDDTGQTTVLVQRGTELRASDVKLSQRYAGTLCHDRWRWTSVAGKQQESGCTRYAADGRSFNFRSVVKEDGQVVLRCLGRGVKGAEADPPRGVSCVDVEKLKPSTWEGRFEESCPPAPPSGPWEGEP